MVFVWLGIFVVSLAVLVKCADLFTNNAKKLGNWLGLPHFIVGVIIVSVGTSLPELVSSIFAVFNGRTEFVAANVVGSNIANIFLVLGFASILAKQFKIKFNMIKVDIPILLGSSLLLYLATIDGQFGIFEAVLGFLGYIVYIKHSISRHKIIKEKGNLNYSILITILVSGVGIYLGAEYLIKSVIQLSHIFGFNDTSIIALTAVAIGTSLPELVVSSAAAIKGDYEIAIGNIIGSNIFNTYIVMSIPALITPLHISSSVATIAIPFMLGATFFYIISTLDKEVTKYEGYMSLILYSLFIWMLF